ncbi:hypothetical protein Scep_021237 [Stephania cephalantha]|uniref:Galactinol--sucrose galactosyltransferase n=1 Tax=Stephania cephalantha TaxID=152367 RepID=A0AAP0FAF3_9MAGN
MEMLGEEYGGRVELARAYFKAFNGSVKKRFGGNGVMASMQQCNDFMFIGTECISLGRVGDDFWSLETQADPNGAYWLQGCHMVHCAYNSLWMGNFIHPDWDMFMSVHPCAAFHAASRAISGGPIYVSDAVGKHDFELLKRLVLPDGSVLRCEGYALPTRDCLFEDPLHDGKTLLKIWNLNKYTGVIGAFNCQGGGWDPKARTNKSAPQFSLPLTTTLSPTNVEWKLHSKNINEAAQAFAVYMFQAKTLTLLHEPTQIIQLSLNPFTFELLTVSPIKTFFVNKRLVSFAPIGLVNMFNTGGAVQSVSFDGEMGFVKVSVRGGGEMRVFASEKPKSCRVDGEEVEFSYDDGERMVVIHLDWCNSSVDYLF